jgi:hypothetical protein
MRRIVEAKVPFGLILEDDATLGPVVNDKFLSKMIDLMKRNQLDILQLRFICLQNSISSRSWVLESLIAFLMKRGTQDSSGVRFVGGDFKKRHMLTWLLPVWLRQARRLPGPPLLDWGDYLGILAKGQMHRGIRIARLKNAAFLQDSQPHRRNTI